MTSWYRLYVRLIRSVLCTASIYYATSYVNCHQAVSIWYQRKPWR